MQTPSVDPFFLLDRCLSYRIARDVTRITGFPITSVRDEWPDRNLDVDPPGDWEIIPHLGDKAGHRRVWITADWGAFSQHSQLILNNRISVLWLRGMESRNFLALSRSQQTHILATVMATVYRIIVSSNSPVFLLASLDVESRMPPVLEKMQGSILDRPPQWHRVPLD